MPGTRQQSPADMIRAAFTAEAAEIKSRRDLSDEGRARQLAKALVTARDEMTKLKRKDTEKLDRRRADLRQKLFGNPRNWDSAATISYRDAQDRADKLKDPQEAAALLERAIMSGDEFLGRAIVMRAMNHITLKGMGDGWAQVADRWVQDQDPTTAEYVQELADLEHDNTDVKTRFTRGLSYTLPTPGDLSGKDIDHMAFEADSPPE
jgi:hypothetical protein